MPRAIIARHSGKCNRCDKPYPEGATIMYGTAEGKRSSYYHYPSCPAEQGLEVTPQSVPEVAAVPTEIQNGNGNDPMRVLADAIAPHLENKFAVKVDEDQVRGMVEEAVSKIAFPREINLTLPDGEKIEIKDAVQHEKFETLATLIGCGLNVFMYGDPGWGKTSAAAAIAAAMGLEFDYLPLNPLTSDSRLVGYKDANGNYHDTSYRRFYENGGVFLVDEAGNGNDNLLTSLNGSLANGHGGFPDKLIKRHKKNIVLAADNTCGRGGKIGFAGRRPLDEAFRDRFFFLEWGEDKKFERTIALQRNPKVGPWVEWVQKVRAFVKAHQIHLTVSPRATYTGADLLRMTKLSVRDIADGVLFRGIDTDTINQILSHAALPKSEEVR